MGENGIEGKWTEPVPDMENQMQGIELKEGGKASSINMATLQYEKWEKKGEMTDKELPLKRGTLTINYLKR